MNNISKKVYNNSTTPVETQYLAGYQYISNVLQFFPTAEGYVNNTVVSGINQYSYVYNYTDHLGNIRLSYKKNGTTLQILEENNYYPFGLKHTYYNTTNAQPNYKYKYQGQERQDELNLNWDSFKWRNYDYAIGRFMSIDPLSEKYSYQSLYNFSENRVVDGRELEGLEWKDIKGNELNNEDLKKVKVYIFYDKEFEKQTKKQYDLAIKEYGVGTVAISNATSEDFFSKDWSSIDGSPQKVVINYHGSVQDITLNSDPNGDGNGSDGEYISSTGDNKTRKSQTEALDVKDLKNDKADFKSTQLQLNTCNAGSLTHSTRGSNLSLLGAFVKYSNFATIRASPVGVSFNDDGTARPQGFKYLHIPWRTVVPDKRKKEEKPIINDHQK